jgi:hypothetical protein
MSKTTTLNQEHEAVMLPKEETVKFILSYSKALSVTKTSSGVALEMLKN